MSSGVHPRRESHETTLPLFFEVSYTGIADALNTEWPEDLVAPQAQHSPVERESAVAAIQALLRAVMPGRRPVAPAKQSEAPAPTQKEGAGETARPGLPAAFTGVGRIAVPAAPGALNRKPLADARGSEALILSRDRKQKEAVHHSRRAEPASPAAPGPAQCRYEPAASAPGAGFAAMPGYWTPSEGSSREWELVLPKMPKVLQPPRRLSRVKGPLLEANYNPEVHFDTGNEPSLPARIWGNLPEKARTAVLVVLLVPGTWLGWRALSPAAESTEVAANTFVMGEGGWMADWATDPGGSKRGRQLSLYRPSMTLSDYRLDFTGRIERKCLGWIFRASDTRNYYGARIELVRDGRFPTVALSHFSVVGGRESAAPAKLIPVMIEAGRPYHVRFEAKGPKFTVWVQDQVVDLWEDGQIKAGGVGFFTERLEQAKILDFRLSVQK